MTQRSSVFAVTRLRRAFFSVRKIIYKIRGNFNREAAKGKRRKAKRMEMVVEDEKIQSCGSTKETEIRREMFEEIAERSEATRPIEIRRRIGIDRKLNSARVVFNSNREKVYKIYKVQCTALLEH